MVHYSQFQTTNDHAFNVYNALTYCKTHGEDMLVFDKGTYDFYYDKSTETLAHISNHDMHGLCRVAFLLEGMRNFTIDGGGSTFLFHGCITPFLLRNCHQVTLRHLTIDYPVTAALETIVTEVGSDYLDVLVQGQETYLVEHDYLYVTDPSGNKRAFRYVFVRSRDNQLAYVPEARDAWVKNEDVRVQDLGERKLRLYNVNMDAVVGTNLTLRVFDTRQACNVAITDCKDISLLDLTMFNSYGMGVLAQKTENVTVDGMLVKATNGRLNSLQADGTHFVHCKGLVKVVNSSFSEQLDDALNVHGIFTKIVDKTDDYILVQYMHFQATGIDIYQAGDTFCTLDPKSLIPTGSYEVAYAEVINRNFTKIYVKGGTGKILVGDVVEDLTWSCDLLFENNRVFNNRARGLLIASKGKTVIRNNYFNTPGVAILFESDGQFWFESGSTTDVEISNNVFENCNYVTAWGKRTITVKPREVFNEGAYYHQYIQITGNRFKGHCNPLLYADNIRELVFRDNVIEDHYGDAFALAVNCGSVSTDAAFSK